MAWESSWAAQTTPWDAGRAAPSLVKWLSEHGPFDGRAFVPGCGRGYDVFELARAGFDAVGLDLAPSARGPFDGARIEAGVDPQRAQLITDDFFEWQPEHSFQLAYDYTFLCAIDPSLRPKWVQAMASRLAPGGLLVATVFPVRDFGGSSDGPPYTLDPLQVDYWLASLFEQVQLDPATVSNPGREGKEWFGVWRRRD